MLELTEYIVKELVDDKTAVSVTESRSGDVCVITIRVTAEDTGKIIGKKGKIITAIRVLAKATGNKKGEKYRIEVEG